MNLRFLLAVIVLLFVGTRDLAQSATRCEQQFKEVVEELTSEVIAAEFREVKLNYVRALVGMGFGDTAYVTRWALTPRGRQGSQGRFPASGEFVVTGVPSGKLGTWMKNVGKDTVGLVLDGHPSSNPGTAALRVGSYYFSFSNIRDFSRGPFQPGKFEGDIIMELTLPISSAEQSAILAFIEARQRREIIAKHSRGAGVEKGAPIAPRFNSEKFTLAQESCAAACTSWFDRRWLEHYEAPEALRQLAERFELKSTFVAKQMVWGHVRLPGPIGITIFGLNFDLGLMASFKENNEWYTVRGIPPYGYIPDPKSGQTGTINSKRFTLEEWLGANP